MASNTTILIIVVAVAALLLTSLVTLVLCKTRIKSRYGIDETIRKQVREDGLRHRRREVLTAESDATPNHHNSVAVFRPGRDH